MKNSIIMRFILMIVCILSLSCKKFLDEKSDSSLAVPSTVVDLQLIMDNYQELNLGYPSSAEVLADNYYPENVDYFSEEFRSLYLWSGAETIFANPWGASYGKILTCNVVLDNIEKVSFKSSEAELVGHIKGSALFFRAFYFYSLAQLFSKPYDPNTAKNDLGIVIRNTSDFNVRSVRATNEETYQKIISDLKECTDLLPEIQNRPNRPTKAAAYGLLARTYLSMKDYVNAGVYAEKTLRIKAELMNYNVLDTLSNAPISRFNKEVIFPMSAGTIPGWTAIFVDTSLYKTYLRDDLRRSCFYQFVSHNKYQFKGDYEGIGIDVYQPNIFSFAGIATDEMYLIKAESKARAGSINDAMKALNDLLVTRWKSGTFVPFIASNVNEALTHILQERRKELVFRTLRWEDLRRLQNDPLFSVTPKRIFNGQEYTLPPNSPSYLMKIPPKVIQQTGMQQNP